MTPTTIGENELLPCPFCGHKPLSIDKWIGKVLGWQIFCQHEDCFAVVGVEELSEAEAIVAWNRRSAGLGTVSVKPLSWFKDASYNLTASCAFGSYHIERPYEASGHPIRLYHNRDPLGEYATVEAAKAAAQSDFETRVKSCLTSIGVEALPQDVINLVIAGREMLDLGYSPDHAEADALDRALEAFSSRVSFENQPEEVFFHATPKPDACVHDFEGWRPFEGGNGGEQVCTKCGIGAMAHTLSMGDLP